MLGLFGQKSLSTAPTCVTAPKKDGRAVTESVFHSPANAFRAMVSGDYLPILQTYEEIVRNTFYGGEALPTLRFFLYA